MSCTPANKGMVSANNKAQANKAHAAAERKIELNANKLGDHMVIHTHVNIHMLSIPSLSAKLIWGLDYLNSPYSNYQHIVVPVESFDCLDDLI
jgi:hypothetical protein